MSDRKRLAHLIRSTRQHEVLVRLAIENGWQLGAEIGVLRGKTLFALLRGVNGLQMYGVDQWKELPLRPDENAETYTDFNMRALRADVYERAKRHADRCEILEGDSVAMATLVGDASLDFVFVDGDHTEAGVESDICAWAPKIRSGGMLLGHDNHWTTVRRVVDRLCPGWTDHGEAVWGIPIDGVRL